MTIALYATIWLALALLAAAALGARRMSPAPPWARNAYAAGVVLAIVHVLIALGNTYEWDHARAVRETARQASEVYDFVWSGSIYVSYAFLLVWALDASRSHTFTRNWIVRGFFLIIIINAAVVFAVTTAGRMAGMLIVATLIVAWWPTHDRRLSR
jgi:hypothetical protein